QLSVGTYFGYASGGSASVVSAPAHNHSTLTFLRAPDPVLINRPFVNPIGHVLLRDVLRSDRRANNQFCSSQQRSHTRTQTSFLGRRTTASSSLLLLRMFAAHCALRLRLSFSPAEKVSVPPALQFYETLIEEDLERRDELAAPQRWIVCKQRYLERERLQKASDAKVRGIEPTVRIIRLACRLKPCHDTGVHT